MKQREEGNERLYPSIFSSRYYYLNQLRKQLSNVTDLYFADAKDLALIDFGCGNMPYQPLFVSKVKQYIGVDLPENPRAQIHIEPTGRIKMDDRGIDIVLSTQVLEHVEDPAHYLKEAHRVLKDKGMLVLSTHGYWMYHPDPTDYWRWTSAGLKKIISQNGFEIVHFSGIIGRSSMGLILFQDGIYFKLPKFLRPLWALFMQPFIALFDLINTQAAKDADGCTYIVVARKI